MKYLKPSAASKRKDYHQENLYSSKKWRIFRRAILAEQGGYCVECDNTYPDYMLHVDHITPIADGGGKWDIHNLQVLCRRCHSRKTFAETIGRGRSKSK